MAPRSHPINPIQGVANLDGSSDGGPPSGFRWPYRQTLLALGDRILLYTDGASEARARGGFFPLQAAAAFALVSADLEAGLESLWAELQRHVAGQLHDDVALLLIEHSR
jgi:phosphoserine phosphatase RsbU/P